MLSFSKIILVAFVSASVIAAPAPDAAEKRLLGGGPAPTIPPGLVKTDSGCFDAGDCFIYAYPDFNVACIAGSCYKPAHVR